MDVSGKEISAEQLQRLALRYSFDAQVLLDGGRWNSAYYLAGYAIECGLKALIARQVKAGTVPSRKFMGDFYSHDLNNLVKFARLSNDLDAASPELRESWNLVVRNWSSEVRYDEYSEELAREVLRAVNDPKHGVLQWLRTFW
jgi:HEPN domain-containing protein